MLVLLRLLPEGDLAGGAVHGVHNGKALQLDALAADELATLLEALLNCDSNTFNSSACLIDNRYKSLECTAVCKKIINYKYMILWTYKLLRYKNLILALMCK